VQTISNKNKVKNTKVTDLLFTNPTGDGAGFVTLLKYHRERMFIVLFGFVDEFHNFLTKVLIFVLSI